MLVPRWTYPFLAALNEHHRGKAVNSLKLPSSSAKTHSGLVSMATTHAPPSAPDLAATPTTTPNIAQMFKRLYKNYTIRVILQALVTVWAVITFTFFLIRLMPGNPVDVYVDFLMNQQNMTYDEAFSRAATQFRFDPDASPITQYGEYIGQL